MNVVTSWAHRVWKRVRTGAATGADAGFTLIETMVAIAMATVVLTAFAYASTSTVQAIQSARLNQQGADIATQQLEHLRTVPFASLGHDSGGIVSDPNLSSGAYQGEPLIEVAGGVVNPQITTTTVNNAAYTTYTYVTRTDDEDGVDNRRVTVIVEWAAYGQTWSKTMSTVMTNMDRGLPLPEFKLTAVGPSTVTVNPGATAAFGFRLTNQGAPDQFNITVNLTGAQIFLDNGDGVYDPITDLVLMSDHNGDGVPDTGRVDPKESVAFWVVREVPVGAANGTSTWDVLAESATQAGEASGSASLGAVLVVTSAVITPSATPSPSVSGTVAPTPSATPTPTSTLESLDRCPATNPAPVPASVTGYSVKAYTLHNSGTSSWPTLPLPVAGPIPGSTAKLPMYMDMASVSIPADRGLPAFSTDLTPSGAPGRLLYSGGSFASTTASQVLNFRTQNEGRSYTGSIVLKLWVKPVSGDAVSLSAQLQTFKTNNASTSAIGSANSVSISDFTCDGWQEVWWQFSPVSIAGANKTVVGVKVWNTGDQTVQVAFDHGAFPATFTVVEK